MHRARKKSTHNRVLRRSNSGGTASNGSRAMMGGGGGSTGGNKSTKLDNTPAVAVDHQHYYRHHLAATTARAPNPTTAQAAPGGDWPTSRTPKSPQTSRYGVMYTFTQTRPTKATGIRRPGPRHQMAMPPLVAAHQKQPTGRSSPGSNRRSLDGTGHREEQQQQQTECSPGGTRRSPYDDEASPPNFSRKTTPSPPTGRSRSNSKTTSEAEEGPTPMGFHDGINIAQTKKYIRLGRNATTTTTTISGSPPQTSHFSPFSESDTTGSDNDSASPVFSISMKQSLSSLKSAPSLTSDVTPAGSPGPKPGGSSSSNLHIPHERSPRPSLTSSSLNKALPLLPASVYQPPAREEAGPTGQKTPLTANREPVPRQRKQQGGRRAVDSPRPLKQSLPSSSLLTDAPPMPARTSPPKQEARAHPVAAVRDAKTLGSTHMGKLYNRRQKTGAARDTTTSLSAELSTDSPATGSEPSRFPPKPNTATILTTKERGAARSASPATSTTTTRGRLQPLNTQRAKEGSSLLSRGPSAERRNLHASTSSSSDRSQGSSSTCSKTVEEALEYYFILSPGGQIRDLLTAPLVNGGDLRPKAHEATPDPQTGSHETRGVGFKPEEAHEASEDKGLKQLMQEVEMGCKDATTAGTQRAEKRGGSNSSSSSNHGAVGTTAAAIGDTKPSSRLSPYRTEQKRQSRCVDPLNLRKKSQESSPPRREYSSTSRHTADKSAQQQQTSVSSMALRSRDTPTPPPSRRVIEDSKISRSSQSSPSKGGRHEGQRLRALGREHEFDRDFGKFF